MGPGLLGPGFVAPWAADRIHPSVTGTLLWGYKHEFDIFDPFVCFNLEGLDASCSSPWNSATYDRRKFGTDLALP